MQNTSLIRLLYFIFIFPCIASAAYAQEIYYGTNKYIEYQAGTLPIIISVPHGGQLEPSTILNRTCNNPVLVTDAYTLETALEIKKQLFALTGCYPHIIISHLKRNKLDPNRNIADGACGNAEAETAWNEFHSFITTARNTANQQYNKKTFFVDLHGHGNPIQRIELGYLLYDDELAQTDDVLNTSQYINNSSIKNLALSNLKNYTHSELLRGPKSFGTLLSNQNFAAVPSQSIPTPGTNSNYFSGGYITAHHTSYATGVEINGVQMELNFTGVRDFPANRELFAIAFSKAMIEFMNTHFEMNWNSCASVSIYKNAADDISIYPNPTQKGQLVYFFNIGNNEYSYSIYNLFGQKLKTGILNNTDNALNTEFLDIGIYIVSILDIKTGNRKLTKLIIQ